LAANDAALNAAATVTDTVGKLQDETTGVTMTGTVTQHEQHQNGNGQPAEEVPIQFDLLTSSEEQDVGPEDMDAKSIQESFNCSAKVFGYMYIFFIFK